MYGRALVENTQFGHAHRQAPPLSHVLILKLICKLRIEENYVYQKINQLVSRYSYNRIKMVNYQWTSKFHLNAFVVVLHKMATKKNEKASK